MTKSDAEKEPDRDVPTASGQSEDAAERKRREARRRLLLGGVAALPVMFSVKRAHAQQTWTQCAQLLEDANPDTVFGWSNFIAGTRDAFGSFALFPPACTEENMESSG